MSCPGSAVASTETASVPSAADQSVARLLGHIEETLAVAAGEYVLGDVQGVLREERSVRRCWVSQSQS